MRKDTIYHITARLVGWRFSSVSVPADKGFLGLLLSVSLLTLLEYLRGTDALRVSESEWEWVDRDTETVETPPVQSQHRLGL